MSLHDLHRLLLPVLCVSSAALASTGVTAQTGAAKEQEDSVLRVCADPHNMPLSDRDGQGYENKIAEELARDLGRRVEYTFFPQRIGFVRNTLRRQDPETGQWKCDVIIGVPKDYELTATTRPYMHSIYALLFPYRKEFEGLKSAEDLLKLPPETLQRLRIGVFARSPGVDWLVRNGLLERAVPYQHQSGDPEVSPMDVIERGLMSKEIDIAIVWGPIAGYLIQRHAGFPSWHAVPFRPDPQIRFDYEIAMGVRFREKEWRDTLDSWIAANQKRIDEILLSYRVPLLDASGRLVAGFQSGEQARVGGVPKRIPLDLEEN